MYHCFSVSVLNGWVIHINIQIHACVYPTASTDWTRSSPRPLSYSNCKLWLGFKWFTSISIFMLASTQLQALTGPEGSSQYLSVLLGFIVARSVTQQNHLTITQLQALRRPGGPMQCLSGLLAFNMARFINQLQALHWPGGPKYPQKMHFHKT